VELTTCLCSIVTSFLDSDLTQTITSFHDVFGCYEDVELLTNILNIPRYVLYFVLFSIIVRCVETLSVIVFIHSSRVRF